MDDLKADIDAFQRGKHEAERFYATGPDIGRLAGELADRHFALGFLWRLAASDEEAHPHITVSSTTS